jgi:GST-like protein
MIDLYTFKTGNGWRASIALEECGLPYRVHKVDFAKEEQHAPAFRRINPLCKIPVIVDSDGPAGRPITISQSGAILLYCAEKSGRYLPSDSVQRLEAMQWMLLAVTDGSDMVGGIVRLSRLPVVPAVTLYKDRLVRMLQCVDAQLSSREYLIGELSVADLALYPIVAFASTLGTDTLPHLTRWFETMSQRPGVARGMMIPE